MLSPELYASPLRAELVRPEPEVRDGTIPLPTEPGLGIELVEEAVEQVPGRALPRRLTSQEAAVDGQRRPRREGRGVGDEPERRFGHLVGAAHPPERVHRHELGALGFVRDESVIPASMTPGARQFARIPCAAYSTAIVRVSISTPAFEAP